MFKIGVINLNIDVMISNRINEIFFQRIKINVSFNNMEGCRNKSE